MISLKKLKKIAIFNHKGGVSKTTTSFNLGWSLANLNKKVLLVDADSQCNLTMYALGSDKYEEYYKIHKYDNIHSALTPAFKSQPKLIEAVNCPQICNNMYLIPGHLDFTENEVQLGISMQLSDALGSMVNLPGAINYLIEKTAQKYEIEYVIVDMNPSLSAINHNIFVCSDYFIIPTSPDLFSLMSIDSLCRVLPLWISWKQKAQKLLDDATYRLPNKVPVFLGYTVNDFNLSKGRPQHSFESFMDTISKKIVEELVPSLKSKNMCLDESIYEEAYEEMQKKGFEGRISYSDIYCLARVSNFNKLIAISNQNSVPVFNVDLNGVSDYENQKKTLRWFRFLYKVLAERIVKITSYEQ